MDRISALRNVEDALTAFEAGELDLTGLEERVTGTLRTYVTDMDAEAPEADGRPFRVTRADNEPGEAPADPEDRPSTIVVAEDAAQARERASTLSGVPADDLEATPL